MAYVSSTVSSATLGTKLVSTTIPVVNEADNQGNQMGFVQSQGSLNKSQIKITSTSHYITSAFAPGALTITSSNQQFHNLSGTLGSYTELAQRTDSASSLLAVLDRGDTTWSGSTAAGRRVFLSWGGSGFDFNTLTADGETLMQ